MAGFTIDEQRFLIFEGCGVFAKGSDLCNQQSLFINRKSIHSAIAVFYVLVC